MAIICLAAWALLTILPDGWLAFGPYNTWGFSADNNGSVYATRNFSGHAGLDTLSKGDVIDLSRTSLDDLLAVFAGGGMQYVHPGSEATLYVHRATATPGIPGLVTLQKIRSVPAMLLLRERILLLLALLLGVTFIAIASALVWQYPNPMTWGFFLYALWFNPGQTFVSYAELLHVSSYAALTQEVVQALCEGAGYAGLLIFALRFPGNRIRPGWERPGRWLPYIGVVIATLRLMGFGTVLGWRTEFVTRAAYLAGYAVDLAAWVILYLHARSQPPIERQRTRWVLWGCAAGLLAFVFADSFTSTSLYAGVTSWTLSQTSILLLYCLNAAVPLAVFHAVRHHRVTDVRLRISRGATRVLTWVLLGIGLWTVFRQIEIRQHDWTGGTFFYVPAVATLTLINEWAHDQLNHLCDRVFFRRHHVAQLRLREHAKRLAEAASLEDIDRVLVDEPLNEMRLESAALYRRDLDGAFSFQRAAGRAHRQPKLVTAAALAAQLAGTRHPVRLPEPKSDGTQAMAYGVPTLAVGVMEGTTVVAIALYGAHVSGDDINDDEVNVLAQLGQAASSACVTIELAKLRQFVRTLQDVRVDNFSD